MNTSTNEVVPFFAVNYKNRLAVRKLLTKHHMANSSKMSGMKFSLLGALLHQCVTSGKCTLEEANAALGTTHVRKPKGSNGSGNIERKPDVVIADDKDVDDVDVLDDDVLDGDDKTNNKVSVTEAIHAVVGADNAEKVQALQTLLEIIANTNSKATVDKSVIEDIIAEKLNEHQADADAHENIKAKFDIETLQQMMAVEIEKAQLKPRVIEIRFADGKIKKVDGNKHRLFGKVLKIVTANDVSGWRQNAWLAGPSGSGKSILASQIAEALELEYYSTGAIQSKYDLIGFIPADGIKGDKTPASLLTPFRIAFEFGGVFAFDDIDASEPKAFVAFNEALANHRMAFPDKMVKQHPNFVCIASANTWGTGATADYVGRNKIDGATLTRFVRVEIGYDEQLERDIVGAEGAEWAKFVQKIRANVTRQGIKILITPRHTIQGHALLSAGIERADVEKMTVFAGLDDTTIAKINRDSDY